MRSVEVLGMIEEIRNKHPDDGVVEAMLMVAVVLNELNWSLTYIKEAVKDNTKAVIALEDAVRGGR